MELQAALQCLHLYSPAPLEAARFYRDTYGMTLERTYRSANASGRLFGAHWSSSLPPVPI